MAGIPLFVVPLDLGLITAGNAAAATPAAHLGEFLYRGMVWRSIGNGNVWARGDMGSPQAIDYVAMLAANAQPGTTIRVRLGDSQAQVDGTAPYDSGALPFIAPAITRDDGLYHSHLELPAQTRRWWRIDIGGHSGDFEASMLVMGKRRIPSKYYETTWQIGQRDLGSISFGRNGVPGIATGATLRTLAYKLSWLTEDEMETLIQPLDEAMGRTTPYLTCFDPDPTVKRQRRTFFGWNESNPSIGKVGFNRFERSFELLSLF